MSKIINGSVCYNDSYHNCKCTRELPPSRYKNSAFRVGFDYICIEKSSTHVEVIHMMPKHLANMIFSDDYYADDYFLKWEKKRHRFNLPRKMFESHFKMLD